MSYPSEEEIYLFELFTQVSLRAHDPRISSPYRLQHERTEVFEKQDLSRCSSYYVFDVDIHLRNVSSYSLLPCVYPRSLSSYSSSSFDSIPWQGVRQSVRGPVLLLRKSLVVWLDENMHAYSIEILVLSTTRLTRLPCLEEVRFLSLSLSLSTHHHLRTDPEETQ